MGNSRDHGMVSGNVWWWRIQFFGRGRAYSISPPSQSLQGHCWQLLRTKVCFPGTWQLFFSLKHFHCTDICSNSTGIVTLRPSFPSSVYVSDTLCFMNSTGHSLFTDGKIGKTFNVLSHCVWNSLSGTETVGLST